MNDQVRDSLRSKFQGFEDAPNVEEIPTVTFSENFLDAINYLLHRRSATSSVTSININELIEDFHQIFGYELKDWIPNFSTQYYSPVLILTVNFIEISSQSRTLSNSSIYTIRPVQDISVDLLFMHLQNEKEREEAEQEGSSLTRKGQGEVNQSVLRVFEQIDLPKAGSKRKKAHHSHANEPAEKKQHIDSIVGIRKAEFKNFLETIQSADGRYSEVAKIREFILNNILLFTLEDIVMIFEICSVNSGSKQSEISVDSIADVPSISLRLQGLFQEQDSEGSSVSSEGSGGSHNISPALIVRLLQGMKVLRPKQVTDHNSMAAGLKSVLLRTRNLFFDNNTLTECFDNLKNFMKSYELLYLYKLLGEKVQMMNSVHIAGVKFNAEQYSKIIHSFKELEPLDSHLARTLWAINERFGLEDFITSRMNNMNDSRSMMMSSLFDRKVVRMHAQFIAKGIIKLMQSIADSFSWEKIDPLYQIVDYLAILLEELDPLGPESKYSQSQDEETLVYLLFILRDQRADDRRIRHLMHATYIFARNIVGISSDRFYDSLVYSISRMNNFTSKYREVEEYLELFTVLLHKCSKFNQMQGPVQQSIKTKYNMVSIVQSYKGLSSGSRIARRFIIALDEQCIVKLRSNTVERSFLDAQIACNWTIEDTMKVYRGFSGMRVNYPLPESKEDMEEREKFENIVMDVMMIPFHHHDLQLTDPDERGYLMAIIETMAQIGREGVEGDVVLDFMFNELVKYLERLSWSMEKERLEMEDFIEVSEGETVESDSRILLYYTLSRVLYLLYSEAADKTELKQQLQSESEVFCFEGAKRKVFGLLTKLLLDNFSVEELKQEMALGPMEKKEYFLLSLQYLASSLKYASSLVMWPELADRYNYLQSLTQQVAGMYCLNAKSLLSVSIKSIRLLMEGFVPLLTYKRHKEEIEKMLGELLRQICENYERSYGDGDNEETSGSRREEQKDKPALVSEMIEKKFLEEFLLLASSKGYLYLLKQSQLLRRSPYFPLFERVFRRALSKIDSFSWYLRLSKMFTSLIHPGSLESLPSKSIFGIQSLTNVKWHAEDGGNEEMYLVRCILKSCYEYLKERKEYAVFFQILSDTKINNMQDYEAFRQQLKSWKADHSQKEKEFLYCLGEEAIEFLYNLSTLFYYPRKASETLENQIICDLISILLQIASTVTIASLGSGSFTSSITPIISNYESAMKLLKSIRGMVNLISILREYEMAEMMKDDKGNHSNHAIGGRSQTDLYSGSQGKSQSSAKGNITIRLKRLDILPFLQHQVLSQNIRKLLSCLTNYSTSSMQASVAGRGGTVKVNGSSKALERLLSKEELLFFRESILTCEMQKEEGERKRQGDGSSYLGGSAILSYEEIRSSLTKLQTECYNSSIFYSPSWRGSGILEGKEGILGSKEWRSLQILFMELLQERLQREVRIEKSSYVDSQSIISPVLALSTVCSFPSQLVIDLRACAVNQPIAREGTDAKRLDFSFRSDGDDFQEEMAVERKSSDCLNQHNLSTEYISGVFGRIVNFYDYQNKWCEEATMSLTKEEGGAKEIEDPRYLIIDIVPMHSCSLSELSHHYYDSERISKYFGVLYGLLMLNVDFLDRVEEVVDYNEAMLRLVQPKLEMLADKVLERLGKFVRRQM